MQRPLFKLFAVLFGVVVALLFAEVIVRMIGGGEKTPQALHYRTAAGERVGADKAAELGVIRMLKPPVSPRPRFTFTAGAEFMICYDNPTGDWLDDQGCVNVKFNSAGIREREEIGFDKPAGQKRLVCIGDSFTFGWGIKPEDNWVRLLEAQLREADDSIRTVNCGAAGATVVDEYRMALEKRFHKFQPDGVIVTLCLNDLIITNGGLGMVSPPPDTGSALVNKIITSTRDPLDLDPDFDWVGFLSGLGPDDPLYTTNNEISHEMLWASGNPKVHLVAMRDWCAERKIPFGLVIWPFLQGLREDQSYPFQTLHDDVAAFCATSDIPLHDVYPSLRGHESSTLWVHPTDWHPNPTAQRLALPGITAFTRTLTGWR